VPLVLGMVLQDLLETSLRQALSVSEGSLMIFVQRPVSAALVVAIALLIAWPVVRRFRAARRPASGLATVEENPT
jgi:putative tricarboxylic transport membrane protein